MQRAQPRDHQHEPQAGGRAEEGTRERGHERIRRSAGSRPMRIIRR